MDGVIFDSEPIHERIFHEFARELGFELPPDGYVNLIGTSSVSQWRQMKERFNLDGTPQELSDAKMEHYKRFLASATDLNPIAGISDLVADLQHKGIPFAIASSNTTDIIEPTLQAVGLYETFTIRVGGNHVERAKPAPDIFLLAAEKLGVRPEDCVVIEDSTNGVLAAIRAGMRCVGYENPNSPGQDLSKATIRLTSLEGVTVDGLRALLNT